MLLPSSLFGVRMPWANKPHETEHDSNPSKSDVSPPPPDIEHPAETSSTSEQLNPEKVQETPPPELSESIQDGLSKLKLEQFSQIEERATDLHKKSKSLNAKIQAIDEFLSLIHQWCTEHPNKPIDCKNPEILKAAESLRQQGIRVPLPEKSLEIGQVGNLFTVLGNQRSLMADEMKEYSSEFQQCTVERNTLLQHFMTMTSGHSRSLLKISSNLSNHN